MKDVIDVLQLQVQREKNKIVPINYQEKNSTYHYIRFIFECGLKLNANPLTISSAATIFHRFFRETDTALYDCYLIAATCLYFAGKLKDEPLKVRDVINVSHNTLHRGSTPLELNDEYWNMRDGIVQAELLIMRMIKFEVHIVHPHKYMLHYLKSLQGWIPEEDWTKIPLIQASYAFLQDFHYDSSIIDYKPQHVAVAAINLALQCYGLQLPYTDEDDSSSNVWYSVFVDDLSREMLWELMEKIMDVYNEDSTK